MRQFSKEPAKMINYWQNFFLVRIPISIVVLVSIFFFSTWKEFQFLTVWILSSFVTNAFVPVYLFKRDYFKVILTEMISFGLLTWLIFSSETDLTIHILCYYYAIYLLIKAVVYSVLYYQFWVFKSSTFNYKLLWLSLPFLFLGLTGFLQSKIDLYVFAFFYKSALLGEYQIISGFFIFSQSIATILVLPYVKNVYRMKNSGIAKLNRLIGLSGLLINAFIVLTIVFILQWFFDIELNLFQIILGYLIGFPSYFYAIRVFYLFRNNKENKVLLVSIWSLLVNLTLSTILLYLGWKITGVLLANGVAQLVCLFLYSQHKIDDKTTQTY